MTPNLIALYAASVLCIAMLVAFARHNRKTGWVKQRGSILEDIAALQESWAEMDRERERTPDNPAAFSTQLANLQIALNREPAVAPSQTAETVAAVN